MSPRQRLRESDYRFGFQILLGVLVGETRQRRFAATNFEPGNLPKNVAVPPITSNSYSFTFKLLIGSNQYSRSGHKCDPGALGRGSGTLFVRRALEDATGIPLSC